MKRILTCLCAACLLLSLCACGSTAESAAPAPEVPPTQSAPAPLPEKAPAAELPATVQNDAASGEESPEPLHIQTPELIGDPHPELKAPPAEPVSISAPVKEEPAPQPPAPQPPEMPQPPAPQPPEMPQPPAQEPPAQEQSPAERKAIAESYIGQNVSALYAAIGKPLSSDYAPSCLGEGGEDGNLYYDGFIVYTYRENGVEEINYVE